MRIFIFLLCLSFNALALDWPDMERGTFYKTTQPLSLTQKLNGTILEIPAGEQFYFKSVYGAIGLAIHTLEWVNCPGFEMETEVEVIPVRNSPVEIGAMVAEGCELWVYVEYKDYFTKAIFE